MQQKVFVLNQHDRPLMPCSPRKARQLLESGHAEKIRRGPFFAIRLKYGSSGYGQTVYFGGDAGYELRKVSRNIQRQRYPYQVGDLAEHQDKLYLVAGMHNKGAHLLLRRCDKSVRPENVKTIH